MARTIPVIYRDGVLVPQVELEDLGEGHRFDIYVPEAEELDLLGDDGDGEPWVGFVSMEDALQVVERTAGMLGPIPPELLEEIAMDESLIEGGF